MLRILVIDDDREIGELIQDMLNGQYVVDYAPSGDKGLAALSKKKYALVLLDVKMPGKDGYEILGILKTNEKYRDIPVIMVTEISHAIEATLGFGADDFIHKPFDAEQLTTRIRHVLQKYQTLPPAVHTASDKLLTIGTRQKIVINLDCYEVFVNNKKIKLSQMEYRLLVLLMENKNRILSRDKIIDQLQNSNVTNRTIDSHVARLRKKLGPCKDYLQTAHGFGYKLSEEINS